jgi:hypothetical protein
MKGMEKKVFTLEDGTTRTETDTEYMQRTFDIAAAMAQFCSLDFVEGGGIYTELVDEKVYFPYLLMKKKNYVGLMYEGNASKPKKIDMKGVDIVKRSVCAFVQQAASSLIPPLMYHRSEDMAAQNLQKHINRLMNDEVPLDDYVHFTKMSAFYKGQDGGANLPQVRVRDAQFKRNPGSEAKPGDYVAFIATEVKGKDPNKLKVADHVEDAEYAKQHNIKPDRHYILSKKLRNLVHKLLQFTSIDCDKMLEEPLRTLENRVMGIQDISKFFGAPLGSAPLGSAPSGSAPSAPFSKESGGGWKRKAEQSIPTESKAQKKARLEKEAQKTASAMSKFFK